jgi:DNA-directed RNA polymerase subunit RPC12/RpoP
MIKLTGKSPYRSDASNRRIWNSGGVAKKGSYVCIHCNTHTALEYTGRLPLCRNCYGRRFRQL